MNKLRRLSASLVVLLLAVTVAAQQSRGITPEDYFAFEFIADPNISPDGKLVAYVVTKVDRAQNRRSSSIWMAATDGSRAPWQFTTSPRSSNRRAGARTENRSPFFHHVPPKQRPRPARDVSAREPQPHPHGRAQTSGGKFELATLLV